MNNTKPIRTVIIIKKRIFIFAINDDRKNSYPLYLFLIFKIKKSIKLLY